MRARTFPGPWYAATAGARPARLPGSRPRNPPRPTHPHVCDRYLNTRIALQFAPLPPTGELHLTPSRDAPARGMPAAGRPSRSGPVSRGFGRRRRHRPTRTAGVCASLETSADHARSPAYPASGLGPGVSPARQRCGARLGQLRLIAASHAWTCVVPFIGLISKVSAVIDSTAQPSLNAARNSSARTRRGPQVPGCRSLKHMR